MTQQIDFLFDFGSPNAYLSHRAIPQIEARSKATFNYVPVLLGGIFKATNNVSPAISLQGIKNKPEYSQIETRRWLDRYGLKAYTPNPHFPVNTLMMMRGAVYAKQQPFFADYVEAMYQCMWEKALKMDELDVLTNSLKEYGLPVEDILNAISDSDIKQGLISNTEKAVNQGAFGSPTFLVGDELFFGKDTLWQVEELVTA